MPRRHLFAIATTGLLALSTLAAALPASAAPAEPPLPVEPSTSDTCPNWGWKELNMWMEGILRNHGRAGYQLSMFEGFTAGPATMDLRCVTDWQFIYNHPTDGAAKGLSISLDLRTGDSKIVEVNPGSPLPKTDMTPQQAIDAMRAHGYDEAFGRLWLAPAQAGTGAAEYEFFTPVFDHILIDAKTGWVSSYEFPDLPDSVIAVRADRLGGGTHTLKPFTCPAPHHPYLWNSDFGVGVNGARFRGYRPGGTMHAPLPTTVNGLVAGWQEKAGGITVRDPGKDDAYLYGLCTNNPSEAYAPAPTE